MMNRIKLNWKTFFLAIAIFLVGLGTGSLLTGIYLKNRFQTLTSKGPQIFKPRIMTMLTRRLDLSENQQRIVESNLKDTFDELNTLKKRREKILDTSIHKIEMELNPQQKNRFKKIVEEWKKKSGRGKTK